METDIATDVAKDDGTHIIKCELTLTPSIDEWSETTVEVEWPLTDFLDTAESNDDVHVVDETERGIVVSVGGANVEVELSQDESDTTVVDDSDATDDTDALLADAHPLEATTSATAATTAEREEQPQNQTAPVGPLTREFADGNVGWQEYAEKRLQEAAEEDHIPDEVGGSADGTVIDETDDELYASK